MNMLEACFAVTTLVLSFWLLFAQKRRRVFGALVIANSLLFAAHVFVDHVRWQMAVFYAFALYLLCYCVLRCSIVPGSHQQGPRFSSTLAAALKLVSVVLLLFSAILVLVLPVPNLPAATGNLPVSTLSLHLVDGSRPELYTEDPSDPRELMVTVWYPAGSSHGSKHKPYVADLGSLSSVIGEELGFPAFVLGHLGNIKTGVTVEASVSDRAERYPLLVFSHGIGVPSSFYTSIIRSLAGNGYIVASIDHTYSTVATSFPDGRVATFQTRVDDNSEEELRRLEDTWVEDISFVITQMEGLNAGSRGSLLKNRIDLDRIGVIGHSFGGAAAYAACYSDDRIRAGINLDGSIYEIDPVLSQVSKRFMLVATREYAEAIREADSALVDYDSLTADRLAELEQQGIDRQEYEEAVDQIRSRMDFLRSIMGSGSLFISVDQAKHYNFSDIGLMSPLVKMMGMTGTIDARRGLDIVNSLSVSFFNEHLKGEGIGLVEELASSYPEVAFESLE